MTFGREAAGLAIERRRLAVGEGGHEVTVLDVADIHAGLVPEGPGERGVAGGAARAEREERVLGRLHGLADDPRRRPGRLPARTVALDQRDGETPPPELSRREQPHHAAADHDDVGRGGHLATSRAPCASTAPMVARMCPGWWRRPAGPPRGRGT